MKIEIEIPNVRVVESTDYKGNPVWYLSIAGIPVLYTTPRHTKLSTSAWEDIFMTCLSRILGKLLLEGESRVFEGEWFMESPTGREVNIEGENF